MCDPQAADGVRMPKVDWASGVTGDRYGFLSLMLNHVVLQLLNHLESKWIKGHTECHNAVDLSQMSYVLQRF